MENQKVVQTAKDRNPKISDNQAQKCDKKLHTWAHFQITPTETAMACRFCFIRKGGLPPLSNKAALTSGKATVKGTLTDANAKKE